MALLAATAGGMTGIAAGAPGFKRVMIAPQLDERLTVNASYESTYVLITEKTSCTKDNWI